MWRKEVEKKNLLCVSLLSHLALRSSGVWLKVWNVEGVTAAGRGDKVAAEIPLKYYIVMILNNPVMRPI